MAWHPTATNANLQLRAKMLRDIRQFFFERDVLEVETPLLSHGTVTDPYIQSISTHINKTTTMYLQTSPEYAMKRLLSADSGAIYQLCKAFRNEEAGRQHNPEFTILEWYRPGFDHFALMDEVDSLLQCLLKTETAEKISYTDLFIKWLDINPITATQDELLTCCQTQSITLPYNLTIDNDVLLQLLMSEYIEPKIGKGKPIMIYHYPASQSALARILPEDPTLAARFEVYFKGFELANGFHELADPIEQRARFDTNNRTRKVQGLPTMPIDEHLLQALEAGLPDCAGVAMGVDRLVMLAAKAKHISDVLAFSTENA